MNPAGTTPVLVADGVPAVPGAAIICEFLDESYGNAMDDDRRLMAVEPNERIEVRRLMSWFNYKFFEEVSGPLVLERIYKRFMKEEDGGGSPVFLTPSPLHPLTPSLRYPTSITTRKPMVCEGESGACPRRAT